MSILDEAEFRQQSIRFPSTHCTGENDPIGSPMIKNDKKGSSDVAPQGTLFEPPLSFFPWRTHRVRFLLYRVMSINQHNHWRVVLRSQVNPDELLQTSYTALHWFTSSCTCTRSHVTCTLTSTFRTITLHRLKIGKKWPQKVGKSGVGFDHHYP